MYKHETNDFYVYKVPNGPAQNYWVFDVTDEQDTTSWPDMYTMRTQRTSALLEVPYDENGVQFGANNMDLMSWISNCIAYPYREGNGTAVLVNRML